MNIVVYSTHCPQCKVLEKKLQMAGIEFTICDDMDKMNYTQAVARLEEIMAAVQGGKVDVDELSGLLKEATELLRFCNDKLYKVDEEVKALINGMGDEEEK